MILLAALFLSFPATARAMDEPDSVNLSDIMLFQDLITTGDILAVAPYNIPFGTTPADDISDTFLFEMRSENSTSLVGTVTAYPFYDSGYGQGLVSFYLESGGSWGDAYVFRVQQNPAYYPSAQYWDFTIGATNYNGESDQALALRAYVIARAQELEIPYNMELISSNDGVITLSTYGEIYFQNAIPGLATMAPALFSLQVRTPDYTKRSWDYTVANALRTQFQGTFIYDAMTGWAGLFSSDIPTGANFFSVFLFLVLLIVDLKYFKASRDAALLDGYAFLLLLTLDGWFSMILAGFIAFVAAFIGGMVLFLNRS